MSETKELLCLNAGSLCAMARLAGLHPLDLDSIAQKAKLSSESIKELTVGSGRVDINFEEMMRVLRVLSKDVYYNKPYDMLSDVFHVCDFILNTMRDVVRHEISKLKEDFELKVKYKAHLNSCPKSIGEIIQNTPDASKYIRAMGDNSGSIKYEHIDCTDARKRCIIKVKGQNAYVVGRFSDGNVAALLNGWMCIASLEPGVRLLRSHKDAVKKVEEYSRSIKTNTWAKTLRAYTPQLQDGVLFSYLTRAGVKYYATIETTNGLRYVHSLGRPCPELLDDFVDSCYVNVNIEVPVEVPAQPVQTEGPNSDDDDLLDEE